MNQYQSPWGNIMPGTHVCMIALLTLCTAHIRIHAADASVIENPLPLHDKDTAVGSCPTQPISSACAYHQRCKGRTVLRSLGVA